MFKKSRKNNEIFSLVLDGFSVAATHLVSIKKQPKTAKYKK